VEIYGPNQDRAQVSAVFPEFHDQAPFQLSGVRLLERVALVTEFEESEFVRLGSATSPDAHDLLIYADTGLLRVETDDQRLYQTIQSYFHRTSDLAFKSFFF
jgi:hypothetical protein